MFLFCLISASFDLMSSMRPPTQPLFGRTLVHRTFRPTTGTVALSWARLRTGPEMPPSATKAPANIVVRRVTSVMVFPPGLDRPYMNHHMKAGESLQLSDA